VAPRIERIDPEDFGASVFLRIERQTLRRLAKNRDVLFTIRTYIRPLGEIVQDADTARRLASAVENLPAAMREYRSMTAFADALVTWLRGRAELPG
jgi:hypothetical protein